MNETEERALPLVWDALQAGTIDMVESVTSGRAGGLGYVNRSKRFSYGDL